MSEYIVTDTEMVALANAIRTKGGTQANLEWTSGFISAVNAISGGGGVEILSGTSEPSSNQGSNGQIYLQHIDLTNVNVREYIENSAVGDYFNLGYYFKASTKFELSAKHLNQISSSYPALFGSRSGTSGRDLNQIFVGGRNSNNSMYYAFGGPETNTADMFTYNVDALFEGDINQLKVTQSGTTKTMKPQGYSLLGDSTLPMYLFVTNLNGTAWSNQWSIMRFYYMKIWEGDVLVKYFLPALDANDEPCLYEAVSGTYLYNQGSGTLTTGDAVSDIPNEIHFEYVKVNDTWVSMRGTDIASVIGSIACDTRFDTLIDGSISGAIVTDATAIRSYGLYNCSNITSLTARNCNSLGTYSLRGCTSLTSIDIGDGTSTTMIIGSGAFTNCSALNSITLRNTSVATLLANTNDTQFASTGTGGTIYVPSSMIASYQADTDWANVLSANQNNQILAIPE